jgi:hypothetical protein
MKSTFQGLGFILAIIAMSVSGAFATPPITVPPDFTAPQEQASNLAVPSVAAPDASSVMAVVLCNKIVGLAVVDVEGTVHAMNLEGLNGADVMKIMQQVPAGRVTSFNAGCPGNPSKDTTVL